MKSLEELYNEVMASDELKEEFLKDREAFLKNHDCQATMEELTEFLKKQLSINKELSFDELAQVAGGTIKPGGTDVCGAAAAVVSNPDPGYCQAGMSPRILGQCESAGIL